MGTIRKESRHVLIEDDYQYALDYATKLFFSGKVFVYPTDTIYGFGGNRFNERAVKKIELIKRRDESKGFIMLLSSVELLSRYVEVRDIAQLSFLRRIFPNAISVVMKLNRRTREETGGRTAAFRIPDNRFCLDLCSKIRLPLISTSVNRRGDPPLNDFSEIKREFDDEVDVIFHTLVKSKKTVSTIIDLTGEKPLLLRQGKVKYQEIIKKL